MSNGSKLAAHAPQSNPNSNPSPTSTVANYCRHIHLMDYSFSIFLMLNTWGLKELYKNWYWTTVCRCGARMLTSIQFIKFQSSTHRVVVKAIIMYFPILLITDCLEKMELQDIKKVIMWMLHVYYTCLLTVYNTRLFIWCLVYLFYVS